MSHYATRAYANVGVNTAIESASPHKLVLMLYDALLKQLRIAKLHLERREIGPKAAAISKALTLIDQGLRLGLDLERGGSIAAQLLALYDYSSERLFYANLKNDVAALDEVIRLIEPIRTAWSQIDPNAAAAQGGMPAVPAPSAQPQPQQQPPAQPAPAATAKPSMPGAAGVAAPKPSMPGAAPGAAKPPVTSHKPGAKR